MVATFVTTYMRQEPTCPKEEKEKEKEDKKRTNRQIEKRKKTQNYSNRK